MTAPITRIGAVPGNTSIVPTPPAKPRAYGPAVVEASSAPARAASWVMWP